MGLSGTHHINLTVSDLERSLKWYEGVFGVVALGDETMCPPATSSPIRYRSLFDLRSMSYVVGLIEHSGVKSYGYEDAITFRDPDNIQLEVCWPNMGFWGSRLMERAAEQQQQPTAPE
jgi:hypothetical protein